MAANPWNRTRRTWIIKKSDMKIDILLKNFEILIQKTCSELFNWADQLLFTFPKKKNWNCNKELSSSFESFIWFPIKQFPKFGSFFFFWADQLLFPTNDWRKKKQYSDFGLIGFSLSHHSSNHARYPYILAPNFSLHLESSHNQNHILKLKIFLNSSKIILKHAPLNNIIQWFRNVGIISKIIKIHKISKSQLDRICMESTVLESLYRMNINYDFGD